MLLMLTHASLLRHLRCFMGVGTLAISAIHGAVYAQSSAGESVRNVVQLTASGRMEVMQDWLQIQLTATHQGRDAAAVQKQLQQSVNEALRILKPQTQGQAMLVRSGSFGVYPQHNEQGKIASWQGRAELMLEGKDFARMSQAAAQVQDMPITNMAFSLSEQGQQKVQEQVQALAIENFKNRAALVAKQFGFTGYALREVSISNHDGVYAPPMLRANAAMPMGAKMDAREAVLVEAGKSQVTVDVSGSVQLQ